VEAEHAGHSQRVWTGRGDTAKRNFERLRDESGFTGSLTIVKDYVAGWRQRAQEMFVPLCMRQVMLPESALVKLSASSVGWSARFIS
jgi:hypothetical protein